MKVEVIATCQLIDVHSFHARPSIKLVQLEGQSAIIKEIWNHCKVQCWITAVNLQSGQFTSDLL